MSELIEAYFVSPANDSEAEESSNEEGDFDNPRPPPTLTESQPDDDLRGYCTSGPYF